jgi:hypothetical protein
MTEGWCSKGRDVGGLNGMREGGEKQEQSGLLPSLIYVDMQLELKLSNEAHASALTRSSTNLRSCMQQSASRASSTGPIPQAFALAKACAGGVGRAFLALLAWRTLSVPLETVSSSFMYFTCNPCCQQILCLYTLPLER